MLHQIEGLKETNLFKEYLLAIGLMHIKASKQHRGALYIYLELVPTVLNELASNSTITTPYRIKLMAGKCVKDVNHFKHSDEYN